MKNNTLSKQLHLFSITSLSIALCLSLLAGISISAHAKSIKRLNSQSNAVACYQSAKIASAKDRYNKRDLWHCNRAIRFDRLSKTTRAKTYINRGILHKKMGNFKLALGDFRRAKKADDNTAAININIGNMLFALAKYDNAIKYYDKALSLQFRHSHLIHVNRAQANEHLGNIDAAISDYKSALHTRPKLAFAKFRLNVLGTDHAPKAIQTSQQVASL